MECREGRNVVGAGGKSLKACIEISRRSTSAMLRVDEHEGSRAWCIKEIGREEKKGKRKKQGGRRGLRESRPG